MASTARDDRPHPRIADDPPGCARAAEILRAVAHPLRLRIVALLCHGETHVNRLAEILEVPQAIVSQQLRILRLKGLVAVLREDGFAHYRLAEPALRKLVACMEQCQAR